MIDILYEAISNKIDETSTLRVQDDGIKLWTDLYNKPHKIDGPAVEWADGAKDWYYHGKLHRTDGPAIEHPNGGKEWWIKGVKINCSSQKEFEKFLRLKSFW